MHYLIRNITSVKKIFTNEDSKRDSYTSIWFLLNHIWSFFSLLGDLKFVLFYTVNTSYKFFSMTCQLVLLCFFTFPFHLLLVAIFVMVSVILWHEPLATSIISETSCLRLRWTVFNKQDPTKCWSFFNCICSF